MSERVTDRRPDGRGTRALPAPAGLPTRRGVTFARVLRAEWGKAVSARATWVSIGGAIAVHAVVAVVVAYNARYALPGELPPELLRLLTLGLVATQIPIVCLGVLVSAAEYPTGAARTTLLAVPRRLSVLSAQVLIVGGLAAVSALAALGTTSLVLLAFPDVAHTLPLADAETLRTLGGAVLYLVAVAVLGVGIGTLTRHPAVGAGAAAVLLILAELGVTMVGASQALSVLPGWAGRLVFATDVEAAATAAGAGVGLTPWSGYAVLAGWAATAVVLAAVRLRHTDA